MDEPALAAICENPSRREARRHSRRETILEVAQQSFLEHGYAATTMSAIAAELGGSKGTLWSYFPAKDLLFAAVLDRATENFQQQLTLLLNPQDYADATLRRFAYGFLERVTSPPALALYRLVMAETTRFPETGRLYHERAIGKVYAQVATYLAALTARGALCAGDPHRAARQLVSLCLSGCHQMLIMGLIGNPDAALIEADAEAAIAVFMRAYGA